MDTIENPARQLAVAQALAYRGVTVEVLSIVDGLSIVTGRIGQVPLVGVDCPNDVLNTASPFRLQTLYHRLRLDSPERLFMLIPEPGRERDAQDLLNQIVRVGIFPSLAP